MTGGDSEQQAASQGRWDWRRCPTDLGHAGGVLVGRGPATLRRPGPGVLAVPGRQHARLFPSSPPRAGRQDLRGGDACELYEEAGLLDVLDGEFPFNVTRVHQALPPKVFEFRSSRTATGVVESLYVDGGRADGPTRSSTRRSRTASSATCSGSPGCSSSPARDQRAVRPRAPQPRRVRYNRRRGIPGDGRPARPRDGAVWPLRRRGAASRHREARRRPGRVAINTSARPRGQLVPRRGLRRRPVEARVSSGLAHPWGDL